MSEELKNEKATIKELISEAEDEDYSDAVIDGKATLDECPDPDVRAVAADVINRDVHDAKTDYENWQFDHDE